MVFKLLFLLSLVLGSVFVDAIGLIEYENEISLLDNVGDNVDEGRSIYLFR